MLDFICSAAIWRQKSAATALARIVEGAVLQLIAAVEREFEAEFDDDLMRDMPVIFALGSLARGEMTLGGTLSLAVGRGDQTPGEQVAAGHRERSWSQGRGRLLRGLRLLFYNDFPCDFSGKFGEPGHDGRQLKSLSHGH